MGDVSAKDPGDSAEDVRYQITPGGHQLDATRRPHGQRLGSPPARQPATAWDPPDARPG